MAGPELVRGDVKSTALISKLNKYKNANYVKFANFVYYGKTRTHQQHVT